MFRVGKLILHFLRRTGSDRFPGVWDAVINQADVSSHSQGAAACFSGSQSLSAAVGCYPHMRWRAAVGQCLLWWGNPAGSKLPPRKHPFLCRCLLRFSQILPVSLDGGGHWLFYVFLFLFITVQEDFHTTEFPSAVFSATVCLKGKKKETQPLLFLGHLHSHGLSKFSDLFRCCDSYWIDRNSPLNIGAALFSLVSKWPLTKPAYLALCL